MALNFDDYNQQMARIQGQIAALKSNTFPPAPFTPKQPPAPLPTVKQVKGLQGAIKYQNDLPPGSKDVVFDEETDHFYLVMKDEDGAVPSKIKRYSFVLDEEVEMESEYITKKDFEEFKEEMRKLLTKEKAEDE